MRYIDPSGNYACDVDGYCFVDGWEDWYEKHPNWTQGNENTCWAVSTSLAITIASTEVVTTDKFLQSYDLAKPQRVGGILKKGVGVPLQTVAAKANRNYYKNAVFIVQPYTREQLQYNIKNDIPTVIQTPFPNWLDAGHDWVVIGMKGDSFLFYNPWGKVVNEVELMNIVADYGIKTTSFDRLMGLWNGLLTPNTMMAVYPKSLTFGFRKSGVGNWIYRNRMEAK